MLLRVSNILPQCQSLGYKHPYLEEAHNRTREMVGGREMHSRV